MAFGTGTITSATGAVSDLFAASGHKAKAAGDRIEAENYDMASRLARQNADFTGVSTAIKEAQQQRELTMAIGGQEAGTAGAGLSEGGSSAALLRDSMSQDALTHAVMEQQGIITAIGYREQQQSFDNMARAANMAADAEDKAATGSTITGILKGITAVASLVTGGLFGGSGGPADAAGGGKGGE